MALRESEARYDQIARAMKVVPLEMDPESLRFTYVGRHAVKQFGHPIEAWSRDGFWLGLVHPDEKREVVERCRSAIQRGVNDDLNYRIRTARRGLHLGASLLESWW